MIKHYFPFALLLLVIAVLTLYVFVRTPKVLLGVKLLVMPLIVVAAVYGYQVSSLTAGRSLELAKLPDRFVYMGHETLTNSQREKTRIEVWTRKGDATILYSIPWTKQMEQAMKKAEQMKKGGKGGQLEMKKRPGKPSKGGGSEQEEEEDPYETNLRLPSDEQPKEPSAPRQMQEEQPRNFSI